VLDTARAFWRQTLALGDATEAVDAEINQLAGLRATRRVVLTARQLAVSDLFDDNVLAHDARSDFLNWGLLTHGHYDDAADSRGHSCGHSCGHSRGIALEWRRRPARWPRNGC